MNGKPTDIRIHVEANKITILCPYAYYDAECLAYRYTQEAPLSLNAVKFPDKMIVTPVKTFSPRVSELVKAGLRRNCFDCIFKMRARERSEHENVPATLVRFRQR